MCYYHLPQKNISYDQAENGIIYLLKILFIWERDRVCTEGEGEADSPLSREPNMGLDPRTLRSRSELKADALTN